jgi:cardiolipin synthase
MPRWINLPNLLTLSRLALVPFIVAAVLAGRHTLALALFFGASMSDVFDGAAARRLGLTTQAGAYLDPIADKCLLSGAYIALAAARIVPLWLVVVIFGRDFYILIGAVLMRWLTAARQFPPSIWGKASTFLQMLTAGAWMTRDVFHGAFFDAFAKSAIWPCAALTVWSGAHYTWRALAGLRTKPAENPGPTSASLR